MAQMYKVFIDNRAIIFLQTEKEINIDSWFLVKSLKQLKKVIDSESDKDICVYSADMNDLYQEYFKKHQKISAAGGIVQRKDKFLVIKRDGIWDLPKGKVEIDEKNRVAAIREIEEECGIENPEIVNKLHTTLHTYNRKGQKYLKKTHWYFMTYHGPKKVKGQKEEGITDVEWFNEKELKRMKKDTYGSISDVIRAFELYNF